MNHENKCNNFLRMEEIEFEKSDYDFEDYLKERKEAKNAHGVEFNMSVNSKDAGIIRDALTAAGHVKMAESFEIRRELSIMHEVKNAGGVEKCLEKWRKSGDYYKDVRDPRYKMKHKVLAV